MAYEDKVIDITAEELEATVKGIVPSLDEKVLKLERIPQYIKTNIDWNYNEDSTAISVQFGKDGESNNLYIRIAGTTGKPDSFGDLTDATAYDIRLERLVDTDDSIQDWSLSENVSDEELTLFRYISIRVATFWRNSNNEIVGFCAYGNENLLEQYISPIEDKIKELDKTKQEVANAIKGNATGTELLLEDVSPIAHKIKVNGMANSSVRAINSGNIITLPYEAGNKTEGGITFTYNADGSITLNGTTSNRIYAYLRWNRIPLTLPSGTYYLKTKVISGGRTGGATWQCIVDSTYNTSSFTLTEAKNVAIRLDINQATATDVTYDNYTFMPILCAENKVPENYLAGTLDVKYTLDDNGLIELDSISPNMTILADSEVAVEYNKDASKLVNRLIIDNQELKSAVIALGGTLNV